MSAFGRETTGEEVVKEFHDQIRGKTIVITGTSHDGLGAQTALDLAKAHPAHIILLARSASKVQPVIDRITQISPTTKATFISISLDRLSSVRSAADEITTLLTDTNTSSPKIDILINNAGIMAVPFSLTEDTQSETHFATNHLGHFLLTLRLAPLLDRGGGGRIVNLSSDGYQISPFQRFSDAASYDPWSGYGASKTANILFSVGLARRGWVAFAVHPGVIFGTGLAEPLGQDEAVKNEMFGRIDGVTRRNTGRPFVMGQPKTKEQGVATTLVAALDEARLSKALSGSYLADCQVEEVSEYARDEALAEELWRISEDLIGEKFER